MGKTAWTWAGAFAAGVLACAGPAAAACVAGSLSNGGFEDDTNCWDATNLGATFTAGGWNHFDVDGNLDHSWSRRGGDFMAILQADEPGVAAEISQTFTITHTSRLSGWAAFLGRDYISADGDLDGDHTPEVPPGNFNDFAQVTVDGFADPLFFTDIATVGNFGFTPWTFFQITLDPGTYTVRLGVTNVGSEFDPSQLLVDSVRISPVPEPAAWTVMIGGLFGAGALIRRHRRWALPA